MSRDRGSQTGFTLVEMAVVIAIIGVMAAFAVVTMARAKPRAQLAGLGTELHAMVHGARQEALARGRDVAVVFYPSTPSTEGTGRILVIADDMGGFMTGAPPAAPNYCDLDPRTPPGYDPLAGPSIQLLGRIDLPRGVTLSAPARAQTFPFPWNLVPAPAAGCSFCGGAAPGGGTRGALRFDSRGRAALFTDCGRPANFPNGGSVALSNADLGGSRVLAILPTGGIRTFSVE